MRYSQPILLSCVASTEAVSASTIQPGQLIRYSSLPFSANNSSVPIHATDGKLTIKGSKSTPGVIVLDYGANVEGFPTFQVLSAMGDTSGLEITYSESREVLDNYYMSDGPLALAAAMDTYRVNQYNISGPLAHTNRLIQGAFRYQKFNLSTAGELVLDNVGVKPSIPTTPLDRLPGYFESSDEVLNRIWAVGARTVQLNDIPANSIPPFWQVSLEGALVESQAPQVLSAGGIAAALTQYQLSFEVKPIAKGFAFSVLADTLNSGIYIFGNIANGSISAHFGSTEGSPQIAFATLPQNITTDVWHKVQVMVNMTEISVAIQEVPVLQFSQTSSFFGSFGFGAALGHSAVFRNLSATSSSGEPIYSASLTDDAFMSDFLVGTNPQDTTVDGSKRDRIAYAGDLDIALVSSLASTNGISYVQGTLDLIGSYQLTPGFFAPNAKIQQKPLSTPIDASQTGLIGYSFNLLTAAAGFYKRTGNENLPKEWAPRAIRMLDWANSQVLPENGLLNISNAAFGGDWNYYDATQSGVVSKFNMIYAYALQECITLLADGGIDTEPYLSRLEALRVAIDKNLWSNDIDAYYVSDTIRNGFGQDSNALAILAGVNKNNHTSSRILKSLEQLSTPVGPFAFSQAVTASGFEKYISPYASAYHLRAAFQSKDSQSALNLLKSLWAPMADPKGSHYTGCFWETLNATGLPALGRTTSLCHGWAAGPTGELSEHVLGVSAVKPGYKEWKIAPMTLGLDWARGRLPVAGGEISVAWNATGNVIKRLEVKSPSGSLGTVIVPLSDGNGSTRGTFDVNGQKVDGNGTFHVVGGETFILTYSP
ncbi:glycoside hydrolase family 78 protein [Bipolaris oryzae ATCC 44560]|uniref:Glycoside hydrolase family 78 protein n=1 Tax=Bipolaris oryzae ATCC 44560 TaxID=930090 RepID=W6Z1J9_COCMI|nr:glycoside hydrolase family 78 protein [Bipolaris oryzae ATCC 44560]EUC43588.1 glycoside hydrolase family 78 protein [Bipolaris oryzae ATCC 44560]